MMGGRREDDQRLAKLEIEIGKIADHLEEVDDHLRGVGGHDSLDTRTTILEKEFRMHGVLLQRISGQFTDLHHMMEEMKSSIVALKLDVSTFKITNVFAKELDTTKLERFKEWLKFWGPIVALFITLIFSNWDKITLHIRSDRYNPPSRLKKEIEADKEKQRAKLLKKKLQAAADIKGHE